MGMGLTLADSHTCLIILRVISLDNSAVMECLKENMADFVGPFGVLLFLYSVILTKVTSTTWVGVVSIDACRGWGYYWRSARKQNNL